MPRTYSHLSYEQRLRVKGLLDKGTKKVDIARALGVHNATIYREIDRGSINGIYDPGHAEEQYRGHLSEKGPFVVIIFYIFFGQNTRKERLISDRSMDQLTKRSMLEFAEQENLHSTWVLLRCKHCAR